MYHFIYLTNIPSFYKLNLFNRIAEHKKILVIFTEQTSIERNSDFYTGERNFDYISIGNYVGIFKTIKLLFILLINSYNKLILAGFDSKELWAAAFLNPKRKNCIVIESSIFESTTLGLKGYIKRIFLKRITTAYVSGKAQKDLALALGFKGIIKITKGVGIFNITDPPKFKEKNEIKNFIYVGRLSKEKNLKYLISTFNELPYLQLNIIGFGPEEKELKSIAKRNIVFHGAIDNIKLPTFYRLNDVLILPSLSEPWGLVIEEAFNNGLPVIVSNMVGCSSEIIEINKNGLIFNLTETDSLKNAILMITDSSLYNNMCRNICEMDFNEIANLQVKCYL